jgi:hypothetical protein
MNQAADLNAVASTIRAARADMNADLDAMERRECERRAERDRQDRNANIDLMRALKRALWQVSPADVNAAGLDYRSMMDKIDRRIVAMEIEVENIKPAYIRIPDIDVTDGGRYSAD